MDKQKFLFVSYDALIADIAWQVAREGHDVRIFIGEEPEREIADGFVEKSKDWRKDADSADVIVFDDVLGMGKWAQELREKGKAVVGGTEYTDKLEDDRSFGQEELKKAGINIIPYETFTSFDDAIAYVREHPDRYVIKPSGQAQNNKRMLFVGEEEDGKDVVQVLEAYRKTGSKDVKVFQLQRRMTGVEVAVGAFFNGTSFIEPINVNFEHKKLFPGNIGPSTGEMGTAMFWSGPNRLFNQTLKKLEPKLAEEGYRGYIDLNCIVNNNGIYPLEFTARFGYPTIMIQQEGMLSPIGELLSDLANGRPSKLRCRSGFQVGVRVIMPPYPFDDPETFETYSHGAAIIFENGRSGVHIEDVKQVSDQWFVAGTTGVVLTVVGMGPTMRQAQQQAYYRVGNILIPHMYYRTDIGNRWFEDSDRLHSWGYLREV